MRLAQKIQGEWLLLDPISSVLRRTKRANAQFQTSRAGLRRRGTKAQLVGETAFGN